METARTSRVVPKLAAVAAVAIILVLGIVVLAVSTPPKSGSTTLSLRTGSSSQGSTASAQWATFNSTTSPSGLQVQAWLPFDHPARREGALRPSLRVQHARNERLPRSGLLGGCGPGRPERQRGVQGRRVRRDAQLRPLRGALHGGQLLPGWRPPDARPACRHELPEPLRCLVVRPAGPVRPQE